MKRLILLAIAVFWVMIPWVSSAKTVISDGELDAVIAEQGVSINFTALTVGGTTTLTSASWGDSDGFGSGSTYPNSGYAGLNAVAIAGNLSVINGAMNVDVGTSGAGDRQYAAADHHVGHDEHECDHDDESGCESGQRK